MRVILMCVTVSMLASASLSAQRLIDRSGMASFFSTAPLEDIEAKNNQALAAMDLQTGEVAVSMLMKGFRFEKALMEEHFNENYVESDKYPKATFKGKLLDYEPLIFRSTDSFSYPVEGELTIHGVTRRLYTSVDFTVGAKEIRAAVNFVVEVEDFDIEIPMSVINNIAKEVEVTAVFNFNQPSPK